MRKNKLSYKATISTRAGNTLCVAVPKNLLSTSNLQKGDQVSVILKKEDNKEDVNNGSKRRAKKNNQ